MTDDGAPLMTAAQMQAHEAACFEAGVIGSAEAMARAGDGVVAAVFTRWPKLRASPGRAVVLCGPGNNGGDGFVVARLLRAAGWTVRVHAMGVDRLPGDAAAAQAAWSAQGEVAPLAAFDPTRAPDLIIDALFGIGLTRPITGEVAEVVARVNGVAGARIVAVDIGSGHCADSGRVLGTAIRAELTVTFHCRKPGHLLMAEPGEVVVCDIGLDAAEVSLHENAAPPYALLAKSGDRHKFDYGHALVMSGPPGRTGAARLAARGALRVGAGVVSVAARSDTVQELAAHLTAIMLRPYETARDLAAQLSEDPRITALCLGPAFGTDAAAADVLAAVLAQARPTVLDADALTLLAQEAAPEVNGACVLTPHAGEFARLFPDIAARLEAPPESGPAYSKVDAARAAAVRAGAVVLLKGRATVIADPGGACILQSGDDATAWLATAGAGDVLAGLICGLLARGMTPFAAAATGAWLHSAAARVVGPGLIAEDLPDAMGAVFRELASGA
ncbi:NAD(P)H-hydrate dehydratase [uncultured Roseobacter sp.]|uniref:NAD(P)H-hydrate dehydratase n=1 Tax=uncultured Roseobacter sp. TaxID=114847 RepID=UPI0026371925|nr:NAD(P)H-hydrate dehydratase [uncultured Roseobacter sp.]